MLSGAALRGRPTSLGRPQQGSIAIAHAPGVPASLSVLSPRAGHSPQTSAAIPAFAPPTALVSFSAACGSAAALPTSPGPLGPLGPLARSGGAPAGPPSPTALGGFASGYVGYDAQPAACTSMLSPSGVPELRRSAYSDLQQGHDAPPGACTSMPSPSGLAGLRRSSYSDLQQGYDAPPAACTSMQSPSGVAGLRRTSYSDLQQGYGSRGGACFNTPSPSGAAGTGSSPYPELQRGGFAQPPGMLPVRAAVPPASLPQAFRTGGLTIAKYPDEEVTFRKVRQPHSDRFLARALAIGTVAVVCAALPPLVIGCVLLADPTYRFWLGVAFPVGLLLSSLSIMLLSVVASVLVYRSRASEEFDERSMAHGGAAFSALLGIALVLLATSGAHGLHATAGHLARGCTSALPDAVALMDFSKVLYGLREVPGCQSATMRSVEACRGWVENRYTAYLRLLEKEFQCGPMCMEVREPRGMRQRRRRELQGPIETGDVIYTSKDAATVQKARLSSWASAAMLFGRGNTQMACFPVVATRLSSLAWTFGDLLFLEGLCLVFASLVAGATPLAAAVLCGGARGRGGTASGPGSSGTLSQQ